MQDTHERPSQLPAKLHRGEIHFQKLTNRHERITQMSQIMMRNHIIDQHKDFFAELEYVFLGTVDEDGQPNAHIFVGEAGFILTPDPYHLMIRTPMLNGHAIKNDLTEGAHISVLGLDLVNRRRNRLHGKVERVGDDFIMIKVSQSYGNCPKYISVREIVARDKIVSESDAISQNGLSDEARKIIKEADTFFIASNYQDGSNSEYEGGDISHRGGIKGVIEIEDDNTLVVPDYQGNYIFNTFGNLLINERAGLLFIDFETGDLMHLKGKAEITELGEYGNTFPGAQRILKIEVTQSSISEQSLPLRWKFIENSPFSPG